MKDTKFKIKICGSGKREMVVNIMKQKEVAKMKIKQKIREINLLIAKSGFNKKSCYVLIREKFKKDVSLKTFYNILKFDKNEDCQKYNLATVADVINAFGTSFKDINLESIFIEKDREELKRKIELIDNRRLFVEKFTKKGIDETIEILTAIRESM